VVEWLEERENWELWRGEAREGLGEAREPMGDESRQGMAREGPGDEARQGKAREETDEAEDMASLPIDKVDATSLAVSEGELTVEVVVVSELLLVCSAFCLVAADTVTWWCPSCS